MSDTPPRFSVVMPTYNRATLIGDSVAACLAQSFGDFELLVVDDGSTDDTVARLATIDDPRLHVLSQRNRGPAAARNRGMQAARGRFVAFLDSDDQWLDDYLATVAEALDKAVGSPSADTLCLYSRLIIDRGVERFWIKPARGLLCDEPIHDYLYVHGGFIQSSTLVLPRALARKVRWDEHITFGDNDQFAIDCWHAGAELRMLPRAMTRYADALSSDALSQLPVHDARSSRYRNFFDWMDTERQRMSAQAWAGFQARFRSVAIAREAPLASTRMVLDAWRSGAMRGPAVLRQLLQNFTPRLYRWLTNGYVRAFGLTWDEARQQ